MIRVLFNSIAPFPSEIRRADGHRKSLSAWLEISYKITEYVVTILNNGNQGPWRLSTQVISLQALLLGHFRLSDG